MQTQENTESNQTRAVKVNDKGKTMLQENQLQKSTFMASLSAQQLQEIIMNSIRA